MFVYIYARRDPARARRAGERGETGGRYCCVSVGVVFSARSDGDRRTLLRINNYVGKRIGRARFGARPARPGRAKGGDGVTHKSISVGRRYVSRERREQPVRTVVRNNSV